MLEFFKILFKQRSFKKKYPEQHKLNQGEERFILLDPTLPLFSVHYPARHQLALYLGRYCNVLRSKV